MTEMTVQPQEIQLIDTRRTSLVPAVYRPHEQITGRQYRRMLRRAWFTCGVLIGINIILAVALYVAQAGPI